MLFRSGRFPPFVEVQVAYVPTAIGGPRARQIDLARHVADGGPIGRRIVGAHLNEIKRQTRVKVQGDDEEVAGRVIINPNRQMKIGNHRREHRLVAVGDGQSRPVRRADQIRVGRLDQCRRQDSS